MEYGMSSVLKFSEQRLESEDDPQIEWLFRFLEQVGNSVPKDTTTKPLPASHPSAPCDSFFLTRVLQKFLPIIDVTDNESISEINHSRVSQLFKNRVSAGT